MSDWYGWYQPDCTADIDMTTGREPLITATKQCGNGACSSWHSNGYHDSALSTDAFNGARRPTRSARQCLGSAVQPATRYVRPGSTSGTTVPPPLWRSDDRP